MSVQRAQDEITSSEFMDWIAYLDKDMLVVTKEEYYLASIAAETRRSFTKHPQKVRVEDFIFRYKEKVKEVSKKLSLEEQKLYWTKRFGFPVKALED